MKEWQEYSDYFLSLLKEFLPDLALALVVLLLGLLVIKLIKRGAQRIMDRKSDMDSSLISFLRNVLGVTLKILLAVSVISMVGIETTSFIAVIGAAGLAIGLALQGTLANFAGGVLILLLKPYRTGDYIEGYGLNGTVHEVQLFYTILYTPQNQVISIPNGQLSNSPIINYTSLETRRLDLSFRIGYKEDLDRAKKVLSDIIQSEERIHGEPTPEILVDEFGDSALTLKIRVWTQNVEFWNLHYDMKETVKKAFDHEGITMPFPQRDIHIKEGTAKNSTENVPD